MGEHDMPRSTEEFHNYVANELRAGDRRMDEIVNTVTLSATTGAAGNFGVTATRLRGTLFMPIANAKFSADWASLPINTIPNSACPFIAVLASTTNTGALRGGGKIAHG